MLQFICLGCLLGYKKIDKKQQQSQQADQNSDKPSPETTGTRSVKRSESMKTKSRVKSGSQTLPRSKSMRQKGSASSKAGNQEASSMSKSQTLTKQGTKSPRRPIDINLSAGPGQRKMGKQKGQGQGMLLAWQHKE